LETRILEQADLPTSLRINAFLIGSRAFEKSLLAKKLSCFEGGLHRESHVPGTAPAAIDPTHNPERLSRRQQRLSGTPEVGIITFDGDSREELALAGCPSLGPAWKPRRVVVTISILLPGRIIIRQQQSHFQLLERDLAPFRRGTFAQFDDKSVMQAQMTEQSMLDEHVDTAEMLVAPVQKPLPELEIIHPEFESDGPHSIDGFHTPPLRSMLFRRTFCDGAIHDISHKA
jgi:hypothetical protein